MNTSALHESDLFLNVLKSSIDKAGELFKL